jgi:ferritin-like protein
MRYYSGCDERYHGNNKQDQKIFRQCILFINNCAIEYYNHLLNKKKTIIYDSINKIHDNICKIIPNFKLRDQL